VIGLVVAGHGSLRDSAGTAMRRVAKLARTAGMAPVCAAGFLNFSRPTFAEAFSECAGSGANEIVVLPYFLIPGHYVERVLPRLLAEAADRHREIGLRVAGPLGHHPALVDLVLERALATLYDSVNDGVNDAANAAGRESGQSTGDALLLMAHGTPTAEANAPIFEVERDLAATGRFSAVATGFLEINRPSLHEAVDRLVTGGARRVIAVPYFLQSGAHVRDELPGVVHDARLRHPLVDFRLADYLGFHRLLLRVVATRFQAALVEPSPCSIGTPTMFPHSVHDPS
jgi:sirohydrochlorin cobaltochelatase